MYNIHIYHIMFSRYEAMSKIYYRDATAAVICYSICERASWEKMKFWISELRENQKVSISFNLLFFFVVVII